MNQSISNDRGCRAYGLQDTLIESDGFKDLKNYVIRAELVSDSSENTTCIRISIRHPLERHLIEETRKKINQHKIFWKIGEDISINVAVLVGLDYQISKIWDGTGVVTFDLYPIPSDSITSI